MHEFGIKYFDTVAVANALAVFRSGFLFCGAEFGNHQLYQLENLGDEGDEAEYLAVEERDDDDDDDEMNQDEEQEAEFQPRSLSSLTLVGELDSLCPFVGGMINNLAQEDTPQMYGLCGRGGGSSLKVIRHGLEVTEMAVSELPGNAKAVWTIKKRIEDEYDSYIVVSFLDATLVLLIGEEVEEVLDSGFISDTPTLGVQLLADNGMLQVTPHALRHIKADGRVNEWQPPPGREIIATTSNSRQVVIALNRGDVILFELDGDLGILSEWGEKLNIGCDVVCLAIPEIQEGRTRALVMAIGCNDQTARLVSIDPNKDLDILGTLALSDMPDSLCLSHVGHTVNELYMFVGLRNGIMQRTALDPATYEMTDTRTRFLGTKPVKLFPMMASQGRQCVLALSTRPWISYKHSGQHRLDPLSYDMLEFAAGFRSEQISEGVVAISENSLRIITVDRLDAQINTVSMPLSYTPRGFVLHSKYKKFVVIESEHGIIGNTEDFAQHYSALPPSQFGYVRNGDGCWASCIRVLDPFTGNSDHILELEDNEAAFSVALVKFYHSNSEIDDHVLVVGTGVDVTLKPRTCKSAYLRVYTFSQTEDGQLVLELLHKTQTAHVPQCLVEFQGQLLAAVGNSLIMYDLGRKQLLRKAHLGGLPTLLTRIVVAPTRHRYAYSKTSDSVKPVFSNRLVVSDVSESVHYVVYSPSAHQFFVVCDDVVPRYITALTFLDRDTVAVSDKFGTFAVLRLPDDLRKQLDRAPAANTDSSTHMALHQILINIMNKKATFQNPRRRLAAAVPSNIGGFGAVGAIQSASSSYALSFEAPYKFELIAQSSIGGSDIITHMVSLPSWPYAFKKLSDYDLSATTDFAAMSGGVDQHHDYNAIDYDYVDAKHLQHSSASASGSSQYPNGTAVAPHSTSSSTAPKAPVLIYFTLLGQIGAMIPLTNKHTDVEFFQTLEMHLRSSTSSHLFSKLGNSHITYKSRVSPVKNIIDGSLCELYSNLPLKIHRSASIFYDEHADENPYADDSSYCLKTEIASSLDRSVGDVIKKLEDIRALHIF
ncbi:Splicing factor 3B subunit 3 [Zancudomyces culisetae]|uniref:Splicing factor 3B subunit 3 n=1 Tax=Zancudomyces culisetae TaxID=1213189 RepID=A0A1R1PHR6_ZANCU|nr:Splicing factor 3B subunit 3 [Zancudomyces culisetae]OMH81532.1 Splicing factor 3B subunit 3 [Zancudomyces culisetae]|eukprot:OMH80520.1 Splicing factor 3B subunit 3 [Zancudomyces culisetae]